MQFMLAELVGPLLWSVLSSQLCNELLLNYVQAVIVHSGLILLTFMSLFHVFLSANTRYGQKYWATALNI